jgi:hypothetical protein
LDGTLVGVGVLPGVDGGGMGPRRRSFARRGRGVVATRDAGGMRRRRRRRTRPRAARSCRVEQDERPIVGGNDTTGPAIPCRRAWPPSRGRVKTTRRADVIMRLAVGIDAMITPITRADQSRPVASTASAQMYFFRDRRTHGRRLPRSHRPCRRATWRQTRLPETAIARARSRRRRTRSAGLSGASEALPRRRCPPRASRRRFPRDSRLARAPTSIGCHRGQREDALEAHVDAVGRAFQEPVAGDGPEDRPRAGPSRKCRR